MPEGRLKTMTILSQYDLWLFDCDGVILQSNQIKSQTMYQVALHFSDEKTAKTFQQYHQINAGFTRFKKFTYLFETLLNRQSFEDDYQKALMMFSQMCMEQLIECPLTANAEKLLTQIPENNHKYIISAASETDLQHIFAEKELDHLFTDIYGGPRTKTEIFADVLARYPNAKPIFFGDAKADYLVAEKYNVDFVFLSDYTDFPDWKAYFRQKNNVKIIKNFSGLFV